MKNGNKPEIRFKHYAGEWENRQLSDVVSLDIIEVNTPKDGYTRLGIRSHAKGTFHENVPAGKQLDAKTMYVVSPNHLIFNITFAWEGAWAITDAEDGGKLVSHRFPQFKFNDEQCDRFYCHRLDNVNFQHQLSLASPGGAGRNRVLNIKEALKIPVHIPKNILEQKQIANFLDNLDNAISCHQQEQEGLLRAKKSLLSKLFPKLGSRVPEVRFKGFSGGWQEKKCGDVLQESKITGNTGANAQKLTVKLWGRGVYSKNSAGSEHTQYYIRKKGQFIYSKLDFLNSAFGVVPEELDGYESTADVPAFDCDGVNPYFMYYVAIQPNFYKRNGMIADGSRKAKRIHAETFLDMPLILPPTEDEQNKIVEVLMKTEEVLNNCQERLDKLQQIKQALLFKMFV